MDKCLSDLTYWLYVLTIVISTYGSALFLWWWIKKGSATTVYSYVTFLLLGEAFSASLSLFARHLFLTEDVEAYAMFIRSPIWPFRHLLVFMALTVLVCHMSYRAFGGK